MTHLASTRIGRRTTGSKSRGVNCGRVVFPARLNARVDVAIQKATGALEFHPEDVENRSQKRTEKKSLAIASFSRGIFTSTAMCFKGKTVSARRTMVKSL
jgi:hypothetical protein